jgi:HEPN domain-containing protein
MQYYIGGRFLALTRQFPVSANLLHHAIEMLLKGALSRTHSRDQIRALRHDLKKLWRAFKTAHPDERLDALDSAISELHKFERMRYPDDEVAKGSLSDLSVERAHAGTMRIRTGSTAPRYSLCLEDVDEIVRLVFEIGSMNPNVYVFGASPEARRFLQARNLHPLPVT